MSGWDEAMTELDHIDDLDPECVELCEALNAIPGLATVMSCCGHNKYPFWVTMDVLSVEAIPLFGEYANESTKDTWKVTLKVHDEQEDGSAALMIHLESVEVGAPAYRAASAMAAKIRTAFPATP